MNKKRIGAVLIAVFLVLPGCARVHFQEATEAEVAQKTFEVKKSHQKLKVGEELTYSIRWLGLKVGTAVAKIEGIEEIRGRDAYHISVLVKSHPVIDLVYPVRDEHHSYVDVEHLHTLRYEKHLQEGSYKASEVTDFYQDENYALFTAENSGDQKKMLIPEHIQDQVSAGYWFRLQPIRVGETIHIPTNADEKNWDLQVEVLRYDRIEIKEMGTFDAVELEPHITFQGIFVRRGDIRGWISVDSKRLPLMMKTKVPVLGTVSVVLESVKEK